MVLKEGGERWVALMEDERRAAAIREYQKTVVSHKEIETQSKKCASYPQGSPRARG